MTTGKASDLDTFLQFYKSTKAPQLRAFLKALYEKSPTAYTTLAPDINSTFAANPNRKKPGRKPRAEAQAGANPF